MAINHTALRSFIDSRPDLFSTKSHSEIADMLNDKTSQLAGDFYDSTLAIGDFLLAIVSGIMKVQTLSEGKQKHYDRILTVLACNQFLRFRDPRIQAVLQAAVSDGLLTQAEIDSVGRLRGSKGEALFGAGTVIRSWDVRKAMVGGDA